MVERYGEGVCGCLGWAAGPPRRGGPSGAVLDSRKRSPTIASMDLRADVSKSDHYTVSLVVGGTGMLAGATRWLAAASSQTLLVARRAEQFDPDTAAVTRVRADWNTPSFPSILAEAIQRVAPVSKALLWLHEPEPILEWLLPLISASQVVLILGSMDGNPRPLAGPGLVTVRLGSVPTSNGRRWLTHDEISDAAIRAMMDGRSRIVGELAPLY